MNHIDALIVELRAASYSARDAIKTTLIALAGGPAGAPVREHLESLKKGELLEIQWEIEEVLEAVTPKKEVVAPPSPPKAEPPPDPNRPLKASDLTLVYDDPRGLMLHKAKVGERWFATQFDPRTQQPQTFELQPAEIAQLKTQLAGSPHWILGSAAATAAAVPAGPSPLAIGGMPPARPPGPPKAGGR